MPNIDFVDELYSDTNRLQDRLKKTLDYELVVAHLPSIDSPGSSKSSAVTESPESPDADTLVIDTDDDATSNQRESPESPDEEIAVENTAAVAMGLVKDILANLNEINAKIGEASDPDDN